MRVYLGHASSPGCSKSVEVSIIAWITTQCRDHCISICAAIIYVSRCIPRHNVLTQNASQSVSHFFHLCVYGEHNTLMYMLLYLFAYVYTHLVGHSFELESMVG